MQSKLKHLDYIQTIIGRMANNSFVLKGWSITLIAALFALSSGSINDKLTFISLFMIVMFWSLDAYFLAKENMFRGRFNEVSIKDEHEIDFSMKLEGDMTNNMHWHISMWSETLLFFYGMMTLIVSMFGYFL